MGREVSESCLDILLIEIVSSYTNGFFAGRPELVAQAVEAVGYQVGNQLCERYTMERPQFSDHLEAIKFICTDFWTNIFKKQIDTLRTDHKGTFVLRDNRFRWLSRASHPDSSATIPSALRNFAESRKMHLYFPCGIIRGALSNLAIPCAVTADGSALPSCSFTIIIRRDEVSNRRDGL
ncbi:Transport protein particle (TRAPP) component [Heracleum sosnowskyi]|uniref:Transport protein particle (TRAPP) component n=1 Tax=Heracleum sosnowskyi TaxID=360622 RepID=A0AAD8H643_9APIA|nr:Transport protein particle (TRAPP) component [Heracleum sosnowskyi]